MFFSLVMQLCVRYPQLKTLLLNKSHLTFKSCCVTTEGGAGAAVWWRLALGREFTPANSKTAEAKGLKETQWSSLKEGRNNTPGAFWSGFIRRSLPDLPHCAPPGAWGQKMPRQFLCPVFGSSLWLVLILQSLISSAATYRRPVSGGKRQSFLERTLILLDVNPRSPVKVLNDNFLSLQLDPSIVKDGWLDFLRYYSFAMTSYARWCFGDADVLVWN